MAYSNKEYFDILLAYGACNYNAVVLAEKYGARFSNQLNLYSARGHEILCIHFPNA
jgi:hypothetical protein